MKQKTLIVVLLLLLCAGVAYFFVYEKAEAPATVTETSENKPIATAEYVCNNQKTISAAYFKGTDATTSAAMPTPTGSVELILSDGRTLKLAQTISGSGIRYSDGNPQVEGNETFVFWSKGNGAQVIDGTDEKNYFGCVAVAPENAAMPNVYHDGQNGFTLLYPNGWTIDQNYTSIHPHAVVPNFHDLKFTVPTTLTTGTNLSNNGTGVSVEMAPLDTCSATAFLDQPVTQTTQTINDTEYLVATSTDAGAGNFYEEYVYALPYSQPCLAIHYLIHSTNIGNYDPGTVTAFNHAALLKQFDAIRDSFRSAK